MRKLQTSITWTTRQLAMLRAEANRLGVSVSDIVRRIVDEWLDAKGDKP